MKFLMLFAVLLIGCSTHTPTWSKATPKQRAEGNFTYDDAYMESDQLTNEIEEDANTIHRLRKEHGFIK